MRWCGRGGRLRSSSGNDSARYLMMSVWRTTPTRRPVAVDERDVPVAAGLHELDRVADRLVQVERARLGGHQRLDRLARGRRRRRRCARRCRARSGRRASRPSGSHTNTESPVPVRWMARRQSARLVPGGDGHGMAAAEDAESLVGQGWDATGDRAFGEVGHARKCSPSLRAIGCATGSLGRAWIDVAPWASAWCWSPAPASPRARSSPRSATHEGPRLADA